ncbi:MAG TPA: tRNA (N6-isopentenyl adenosine(37)-C2)-methylthiotransferase MiaB [Myxococcota bacterium]|nr:tRNA (N6-isopentenyl adenosine(37)-C2)-methylthiotransferase MiaB [Myxococcota bacterium]
MAPRRFHIRTYGCQMNALDSQKVAALLCGAGYAVSADYDDADVLIVNTCSIRDKAEQRLYADLGRLRAWKALRPGRVIGVAGCVAQQEGDAILRRFAAVDFVYGTHNLRLVPALVAAAERGERSERTDESRSLARFDLPQRHPDLPSETPGRAFVTVMEGCDMFCTFCVVPRTRGREISRAAAAIEEEVRDLASSHGVREITLLGQTVNAYGRHDLRRGRAAAAGTESFATLLDRLARVPGIERIRYTSPHPVFFDDDLVRAHGELAPLCPHVHLPAQSGSDAVLARMRRPYTAAAYRALCERLRAARPDVAITTDLIVGFPGETDADFRATLALVAHVGFVDAYTFKYSPRPGTPAAGYADAVDPAVAQARLAELQDLQRSLTLAAHRRRVGSETEVLVEGASRRGAGQATGRDPYHRVVNLAAEAEFPLRSGDLVRARVVEATPHSLIGEPVGAARPIAVKNQAFRADTGERSAQL